MTFGVSHSFPPHVTVIKVISTGLSRRLFLRSSEGKKPLEKSLQVGTVLVHLHLARIKGSQAC